MRRTIMVIAGLALLGTTAGCGRSSLHSAALDDVPSSTRRAPAAAPPSKAVPTTQAAPNSAAPAGSAALTELLNAVQRQMAAKRSAHFDFAGGIASQSSAEQQVGGRPPVAPIETGVLAVDGPRLMLDHDSQQAGSAPGRAVDDHRIFVGGALYEKIVPGLLTYQAPPDRPWLKITDAEPSGKARSRLQDEQGFANALLPTTELIGFRTAARLTGSADDPQQGRRATRYDIAVDVQEALAMPTSPELKMALTSAQRDHQAQLRYQLWLDADQLPIKITSDLPGPDGAAGAQSVSYRDWGAKLPIVAPPAKTTCTTKDLRPL